MTVRLRVGTRPSPLAVTQAELASAALRDAGRRTGLEVDIQLVAISTTGDRVTDRPLRDIGTKGIFTSELQAAVADGRVDVAVHSAKDLTGAEPPGLVLAAVLERADPRDVLVTRTRSDLDGLSSDARVGTSSVRRRAQLRAVRPDLELTDLRGNVGTRVDKVRSGQVDAAILAAAGLMRLGMAADVDQWLDPVVFCPPPGQGTVAVEASIDRFHDDLAWIAGADHADTRAALEVERTLLLSVEGACTVPLGAWARVDRSDLVADAFVAAMDGSRAVRAAVRGPLSDPRALGLRLADALVEAGAGPVLDELRGPR